jgi:hypothetical protein
MKLTKALKSALRQLDAMGKTWTITMVDDYYVKARTLEKLGFVEFMPRFHKRGKYRGQPNGYDVAVTSEGKAALGR